MGQTAAETRSSTESYRYLDTFAEVFELVRDQFVEELSDKELIEAAISGMLQRLDPHSSYYGTDSLKELREQTTGKFGGLGIQVTMKDELVLIISPISDTPASRAGLASKDLISHIDGISVRGQALSEIVELMRGEIGTSVELTIIREGVDAFMVTLTREIIVENPVFWHRIRDTGYVRIRSFSEQAYSHMSKAITHLRNGLHENKDTSPSDRPLKGLVLDLRNNPGGLLDQAIKVTDAFLDMGEIVSTRGRNNKRIQRFQAMPGDLMGTLPMVVLINSGSASASEIVAGALQDHKRALIMGTSSFGKGSVQNIIPLSSEAGAIRLTIQLYYSPSGNTIQAVGIKPDIVVEQAELNPVRVSVIPQSEASNRGALENDSQQTKNTVNDDDDDNGGESYIRNDYQLARAIDAIKVLSLAQQAR